jgi:ubiquinone/menaquinone biosynthesis C-methylase UbiE
MLLRRLYYLMSPGLRRIARRVFYFPSDISDSIFKTREKLTPPKGMIFTGRGDFISQGNIIQSFIIRLCNLQPDSHVLDIGCGIGRIARPMANFLNSEGSYDGFDVVLDGITWCKKAYKDYPNFRFKHIPLQNDLYNLSTRNKASALRFPYPSNQFDLVVLTSVFTHMQEPEVRQYLLEIGRVLQKGKYCFCTFFIITPESDNFLKKSREPFFKYRYDSYFLHDNRVRDANIAYKYGVIEEMLRTSGLLIKSFHPGWWAGLKKDECLNFQDVLIITSLN